MFVSQTKTFRNYAPVLKYARRYRNIHWTYSTNWLPLFLGWIDFEIFLICPARDKKSSGSELWKRETNLNLIGSILYKCLVCFILQLFYVFLAMSCLILQYKPIIAWVMYRLNFIAVQAVLWENYFTPFKTVKYELDSVVFIDAFIYYFLYYETIRIISKYFDIFSCTPLIFFLSYYFRIGSLD